jgi:hypothetical protein
MVEVTAKCVWNKREIIELGNALAAPKRAHEPVGRQRFGSCAHNSLRLSL